MGRAHVVWSTTTITQPIDTGVPHAMGARKKVKMIIVKQDVTLAGLILNEKERELQFTGVTIGQFGIGILKSVKRAAHLRVHTDKTVTCPSCGGGGFDWYPQMATEECPDCKGTGQVTPSRG